MGLTQMGREAQRTQSMKEDVSRKKLALMVLHVKILPYCQGPEPMLPCPESFVIIWDRNASSFVILHLSVLVMPALCWN